MLETIYCTATKILYAYFQDPGLSLSLKSWFLKRKDGLSSRSVMLFNHIYLACDVISSLAEIQSPQSLLIHSPDKAW